MHTLKNLIMLLALSQLSACAVMNKNDCISADWREVGYKVGLKGDVNKIETFETRKKLCSTHGVSANWDQFELGHADGIVQYCQLSNAVELGVDGVNQVIEDQVCSGRDYPGFRQAFGTGYRLYELRSRVQEINRSIGNLDREVNRDRRDTRRPSRDIVSESLGKPQPSNGKSRRQSRPISTQTLEREIEQQRQRLRQAQAAARDYSVYVYQDYLPSLVDEFVDPRNKKGSTEKPKQSEFDDRIDELLKE